LRSVRQAPVSEPDVDVVVVGGGAAGLSAALAAADAGRRVVVVVKGDLGDGSTRWAQGGLAAVVDPGDSVAGHVRDTVVAGAGLCDHAAVATLVRTAPEAVARLQRLGARFDQVAGRLQLGREGGHSRHRIVHAGGDASGAELSRTLVAAVRRAGVEVVERSTVTDVLLDERGHAAGVEMLDITGGRRRLSALAVVVATGGIGQAYATTTNPPEATGDGLALALRAGATVRDVEFVQFHPTALWSSDAVGVQQPLVTEALRGAGAVLVDDTGRRLMRDAHPLSDLAPRDVVAATLAQHMAAAGTDHVYLDATSLGADHLRRAFPTVLAACRRAGVDPATEPVPVAPAAHYHCGGVEADLAGRTEVPGLFAVGEVACTGVHGANRLASNSLTEALIAGSAVGELLGRRLPAAHGDVTAPPATSTTDPVLRATITQALSRSAGVARDADGLRSLLADLAALPVTGRAPADRAEVEASNLHLVAQLVATAALQREESRGCHRRSDFPHTAAHPDVPVRLRLDAGVLRSSVDEFGRTA
jgi:L-aspartate oxidase